MQRLPIERLPIERLPIERLEVRRALLDAGPPWVLSHDLPGRTASPVSGMALIVSEPVQGEGARSPENYDLRRLGPDQRPGGDDQLLRVLPAYADDGTRIDLDLWGKEPISLDNRLRVSYATVVTWWWQREPAGLSVTQAASTTAIRGHPAYFVSDDTFIDRPIEARIKVEASGVTAEGGGFVGLVFGFQEAAFTSPMKPNDYYALTWKRTTEVATYPNRGGVTAEEGLKLIRVRNSSPLDADTMGALLWDGEDAAVGGGSLSVLASRLGDDMGWEPSTEYDVTIGCQSDGSINLSVRRHADQAVVWQTGIVDTMRLGAGRIGFINLNQPLTVYSAIQQTETLSEGLYQLTVRSGSPGLRDLDGEFLDGNGDRQAGDDFVTTSLIDFAAPQLTRVFPLVDALVVTYRDSGGHGSGEHDQPCPLSIGHQRR